MQPRDYAKLANWGQQRLSGVLSLDVALLGKPLCVCRAQLGVGMMLMTRGAGGSNQQKHHLDEYYFEAPFSSPPPETSPETPPAVSP